MKPMSKMTVAELAAYVQSHLRSNGIEVVLTGGSVVSIYSQGKYVSKDLDFVVINFPKRHKIRDAMETIGFRQSARHFVHPEVEYLIEFPGGPLSVGKQKVSSIESREYETGSLKIISPTDCVKDRLAAYYHWGDQQSLAQAVLVSKDHEINLEDIRRWSAGEGKRDEFEKIEAKLSGLVS